jgi:hypothetical protein
LAKIATIHDRVFAVIANGTTALAGIDRSTGHVLFLTPIWVGTVWSLFVEGGLPIVRSRSSDLWVVTIHDPATGTVRYRDSRPRARVRPQ